MKWLKPSCMHSERRQVCKLPQMSWLLDPYHQQPHVCKGLLVFKTYFYKEHFFLNCLIRFLPGWVIYFIHSIWIEKRWRGKLNLHLKIYSCKLKANPPEMHTSLKILFWHPYPRFQKKVLCYWIVLLHCDNVKGGHTLTGWFPTLCRDHYLPVSLGNAISGLAVLFSLFSFLLCMQMCTFSVPCVGVGLP